MFNLSTFEIFVKWATGLQSPKKGKWERKRKRKGKRKREKRMRGRGRDV